MKLHQEHPRNFQQFKYVYPVISRRSNGLSLGINLNPDGKCSYNCVYCQVPEHEKNPLAKIDLSVLKRELTAVIDSIFSNELFKIEPFSRLQEPEKKIFRDIAIAGNGEPSLVPCLPEVMEIIIELSAEYKLPHTVLITNASGLHLPSCQKALKTLAALNGCVWAKLDAGSPKFHKKINRSTISLDKIVENIANTPPTIKLFIQTCWFKWNNEPLPPQEIELYKEQICKIMAQRPLEGIQIYTVARQPKESQVSPIGLEELQEFALPLHNLSVNICFYD